MTFDSHAGHTGNAGIDDLLSAELRAAGILASSNSELMRKTSPVGSVVVGHLHGWYFERTGTGWMASGPGLPLEYAERLHQTHGQQVRVEGLSNAPSPLEQCRGLAVGSYAVDTQDGLQALASSIRQCVDDAQARFDQVQAARAAQGQPRLDVVYSVIAYDEAGVTGYGENASGKFTTRKLAFAHACKYERLNPSVWMKLTMKPIVTPLGSQSVHIEGVDSPIEVEMSKTISMTPITVKLDHRVQPTPVASAEEHADHAAPDSADGPAPTPGMAR